MSQDIAFERLQSETIDAPEFFVITSQGFTLFILGTLFIFAGIIYKNAAFTIAGFSLTATLFYAIIRIQMLKPLNVDVQLQLYSTQIKAKTFLPVSILITADKKIIGIIELKTSEGLFSLISNEKQLIRTQSDNPVTTTFLLYAPRRGKERLDVISLKYYGVFNLAHLEKRVIVKRTILVLPEPQRVQLPWSLKQKILDNLVSQISIAVRGRGTDFLALRDFQFGDEIRHISWKATAKFNKLIVKEFQEPKRLRFLIIADSSLFMAGAKLEFALSSVIELSSMIQRSEHSVKILVHNVDTQKYVMVSNTTAASRALDIELHNIKAQGTNFDYDTLVQSIKARNLLDTVVILLTDLEQSVDTVKNGLTLLRPLVQRIFFFAFNTPGFGTMAVAKQRDMNEESLSHLNYRRLIVEPVIQFEYEQRITEYRRIVTAANAKLHVVNSYNTNILLELEKSLQLENRIATQSKIVEVPYHA